MGYFTYFKFLNQLNYFVYADYRRMQAVRKPVAFYKQQSQEYSLSGSGY